MGSLAGRLYLTGSRFLKHAQLGRPLPSAPCSSDIPRRHRSTKSSDDQAVPLTGYWADILNEKDILRREPPEVVQSLTRTAPEPPPADSSPKTEKEERLEKARVVFGSRLAGPTERRQEIEAASHDVAGIMVPPKPTEPDNCCMSGCVNCVWDVYRDDLEEWATKSAAAKQNIQAQKTGVSATGSMAQEPGKPSHVATSMDDDGGGSDTNWESGLAKSENEDDLFANVPIGIREFMRTEKLLKQKQSTEKGVND